MALRRMYWATGTAECSTWDRPTICTVHARSRSSALPAESVDGGSICRVVGILGCNNDATKSKESKTESPARLHDGRGDHRHGHYDYQHDWTDGGVRGGGGRDAIGAGRLDRAAESAGGDGEHLHRAQHAAGQLRADR